MGSSQVVLISRSWMLEPQPAGGQHIASQAERGQSGTHILYGNVCDIKHKCYCCMNT